MRERVRVRARESQSESERESERESVCYVRTWVSPPPEAQEVRRLGRQNKKQDSNKQCRSRIGHKPRKRGRETFIKHLERESGRETFINHLERERQRDMH